MPMPIAIWNPARGVWEKPDTNILCGQQVPYVETWPASGMTLSGELFPHPGLERPTSGTGFSSSDGMLPTPETKSRIRQSPRGPRPTSGPHRGGVTETLEQVLVKLPTPQAHDLKGPPGTAARARKGFQSSLPASIAQLSNGGSTPPPLSDGQLFWDGQPLTQLSLDETDGGFLPPSPSG